MRAHAPCALRAGARPPLHQLLLGTLGTDDVGGVRDEATADQRRLAAGAAEAVVVPVAILERNESRTTDACVAQRADEWEWGEGNKMKRNKKQKENDKHSNTIGLRRRQLFACPLFTCVRACVRAYRF